MERCERLRIGLAMAAGATGLAALTYAASDVVMHGALALPTPQDVTLLAAAILVPGFAFVVFQVRDLRKSLRRHDEVRTQTLALARCMKDLTRRMAYIEAARADGVETAPHDTKAPPPPPLVVATMMMPPKPSATRDVDTTSLPAKTGAHHRSVLRRVLSLPQRRLTGFVLTRLSEGPMAGDDAAEMVDLARDRLKRHGGPEPMTMTLRPGPLASGDWQRIATLLHGTDPSLAARLTITVTQASLCTIAPDVVRALESLSRHGIGLCLAEMASTGFDAAALHACGFRQVVLPAARLVAAAQHDDRAIVDLHARLAPFGIALVADEVNDDTLVPELIDLGVTQFCGSVADDPFAALRATARRVAAPIPAALLRRAG